MEKTMKPTDEDVKEMVSALFEAGTQEAEMGERELRFFCRSAARMIKGLRPDLSFDSAYESDY
jgi:hypothetical protein